jgi:hypothetical protein
LGFEESALARLRRYREEADRSLAVQREVEETAHRFSERLFTGLEGGAALGRRAGLGVEVKREGNVLVLWVEATTAAKARLTLGLLEGIAAETDEDLMHEELSRYSLDPSGYSGRILGWLEEVGEAACPTFAVYGTGYGRRRASSWQRPLGR